MSVLGYCPLRGSSKDSVLCQGQKILVVLYWNSVFGVKKAVKSKILQLYCSNKAYSNP